MGQRRRRLANIKPALDERFMGNRQREPSKQYWLSQQTRVNHVLVQCWPNIKPT